jgi:hypothetical protein
MTIVKVVCPSCDGSGCGSAVIRVRGGFGGAVGLSGAGGGCPNCNMSGEVTPEKRERLLAKQRESQQQTNVAFHHSPRGVGITEQALSPKVGGGWHTLWWSGPEPDHPGCLTFGPEGRAAVFPSEQDAADAFEAFLNQRPPGWPRPRLPPAQLVAPM